MADDNQNPPVTPPADPPVANPPKAEDTKKPSAKKSTERTTPHDEAPDGGRYIVSGQLVNAEGKAINKDGSLKEE